MAVPVIHSLIVRGALANDLHSAGLQEICYLHADC